MALALFCRISKLRNGMRAKMTVIATLGFGFFIWFSFSAFSTSFRIQRSSFVDIDEHLISIPKESGSSFKSKTIANNEMQLESRREDGIWPKPKNSSNYIHHMDSSTDGPSLPHGENTNKEQKALENDQNKRIKEAEVETEDVGGGGGLDGEYGGEKGKEIRENGGFISNIDDPKGKLVKTDSIFELKDNYKWKLCSANSKHNFVPCLDSEKLFRKNVIARHRERSCPVSPIMCLVPLPDHGYGSPMKWPEIAPAVS